MTWGQTGFRKRTWKSAEVPYNILKILGETKRMQQKNDKLDYLRRDLIGPRNPVFPMQTPAAVVFVCALLGGSIMVTACDSAPPRPTVSIYDAVAWGNVEEVRSHFHYKTASLNGEEGNLPLLFVAIAKEQPETVELLLSYGADPNSICDMDRIIVKYLRDYEIDRRGKKTALNLAVERMNLEVVRTLLLAGADSSLQVHTRVNNIEMAERMVKRAPAYASLLEGTKLSGDDRKAAEAIDRKHKKGVYVSILKLLKQ
jgi:ankyrin repeat protein